MNRRTSLPGVEELFGPSGPPGERMRSRQADPAEEERPEPPAVSAPAAPESAGHAAATTGVDAAQAEALGLVRQVAAVEGPALRAAREAAADHDVPSPEVGALLRWAASVTRARAVVEIGSAAGVSGLWLLAGMTPGGVLTSLEPDPEVHRRTTNAFKDLPADPRVRSIPGEASTLLERLADASYDLVVLQTDQGRYPEHLARARDLVRPGGMLLARGVLPAGEHHAVLTRFLHDLVEDPTLAPTVLPLDGGVALAHRSHDPLPG